MIFSLDVRRARKGDCLLLHYGTKKIPGLAIIDGGPANVYTPHLKPRIMQIRKARGLADDAPLPVDLLMVSHIDDDHINGILELSGELVVAKKEKRPPFLKVRSLWHNTFDDILGNDPKELRTAVTASFGVASTAPAVDFDEFEQEGLNPDALKVLASVEQGARLRDDARFLGWSNVEFGKHLIMAAGGQEPADLKKGLTLTVAGPMQPELFKLQKEHDAWVKEQEKKKKAKKTLAAFTDTSVPNLSSLVVLASVEDQTMLLTGDARGDKILEGLELMGLLKPGGKLHVNVLKMPHHGSDRNMNRPFFQQITADHYVFSGNGEHGNPERETLQMLLDESDDVPFAIHLTYPVNEIDVEREKDWNKEQQKEKTRKKRNPDVEVREKWSAKKHSLTAFFAANPDFGKKVSIVEENVPHVINLLDDVGF